MRKLFKITFCLILLFIAVFYLATVCVLPHILSNKTTINKLQALILDKTGIDANISGLDFRISPLLNVDLNIDRIEAKSNNVLVTDIKSLAINCKLLQKHLALIGADDIYIDANVLKQFKKEKNKKKFKLKLKNFPEIHIKKLTYKLDVASVFCENINSKKDFILLKASINTPYLNETLKLGELGSLQIVKNKFKANQFEIKSGNSNLYIDGYYADKDDFDFSIKGENIPVSELMPALLRFQKSKDPSKKFIENFKNFKGTVNVNLKLNKDGIWGTCIANNLRANAVWFNIPLFFKEAVFNFRGKTIDSIAEGILGNEKVIHTLNVTELGTPEKEVIGTMKTTLTKKFNFVPNLTILNSVNADLVYKIKDKKPDVYYNIEIPANSDLIYNSFYLGLREHHRKIYANTFKNGSNLYLKEYKYSYSDFNKENTILFGDGLFIKNADKQNPDKFVPQYLTIRTAGYAPTSVIGSFGEKVSGGEFKGDLKYDFVNNQVIGNFDIIKAKYKTFRINNAHVVAKNGVLSIISDGLFNGEKYTAELNAKNNIFGETLIYNMKLFLDKLFIVTDSETDKKTKSANSENIAKKIKETELTVNNWEVVINEIKRDKFLLKNVILFGCMKNNVFDFKMEELNFADGTVHANGIYDFSKDKSKISFEAKNINSDKAANMMLNLEHQIEGTANAKVELEARDMFKFIDAHCMFEVFEGFLPKLGNKEFAVKNTKYKLSDITNVDLSQKDLMKDDIKGTFDVHNTELNNIDITTWHKLSATYLEGDYDMEKQYADLKLYWHYSKEAPKGARILGIPFGLILKVVFRPERSKEMYQDKLSKIPKIDSEEKNSNYYRIHLKGDINNNKVNITLKEVK